MPKYTPTEDEMGGLYPSEAAPAESETESVETTETETETVDEEADEQPSALLPKSALAGMSLKEGETITLKVVKDYGDEIEVSPVSGPSKPKKSMMTSSDDELDMMAKETM
jgi:hypothetical protein